MHLSRVGAEGQDRANKFDNLRHDHFDPITVKSRKQWARSGGDDDEELEHHRKYLRLHHRTALDRYLMPPEINLITRRPPVPIPIHRSRELLRRRFAFVVFIFFVNSRRCDCLVWVPWHEQFISIVSPSAKHCVPSHSPRGFAYSTNFTPLSRRWSLFSSKLFSLQIKTNSQLVKPTFSSAGINRSCPQITSITKRR